MSMGHSILSHNRTARKVQTTLVSGTFCEPAVGSKTQPGAGFCPNTGCYSPGDTHECNWAAFSEPSDTGLGTEIAWRTKNRLGEKNALGECLDLSEDALLGHPDDSAAPP